MIERAYREEEQLGLAVWHQDEAGPYATVPYPGATWLPEGPPLRQVHEYLPNGTAKRLTLFHPATGQVCATGVTSRSHAVLHPWLQAEVSAIVAALPSIDQTASAAHRAQWETWQEGLTIRPTLPAEVPPLRMLLIWDNLAGHKTPEMVVWLFRHGIMPRYTPWGGSWLNMAESIQRIVKRRALDGSHPTTTDEIIAWLEAVVHAWNRNPTPFEWGGKRAARRVRSRERRHRLGGSGAYTRRPLRRTTIVEQWQFTT